MAMPKMLTRYMERLKRTCNAATFRIPAHPPMHPQTAMAASDGPKLPIQLVGNRNGNSHFEDAIISPPQNPGEETGKEEE
ncbi:MAG: hypothetical protein LUQ62_01440 [Methanomicrobiales archaeon]|nr:hypothetical protein [Methanomicrobiales archaeon]